MAVNRTERRRTADWVEYDVIDDAKNVWIERDDLKDGKVVGTVWVTEPSKQGSPPPKRQFADKPTNPYVMRVPGGTRFSFGHNAEKALYRGLILGGAACGALIGLFDLLAKAVL